MRRSSRWASWLCVLVIGLVIGSAAATAETPESGDDISDETAKEVLQLLRDGKKAYKKDDYQKAYDLFDKAYDKWPRPAILVRLGKTAEELGNHRKALRHYRAFLEAKPDADMSDKIKERVADLEEKVPAMVRVSSTPKGAPVYRGESTDDKVGETPVEIEVEPGKHTWSIRLEGYQNVTKTVEVGDSETRELTVELEALGSGPRLTGSDASDQGGGSAGGGGPLATWGWSTGVVGLAGIGTGVAFTFLQGQAVTKVDNYQRGTAGATREELNSLKAQARMRHRIALIAYSAGGALAATGIGLLTSHYLGGGSGRGASARVGPRFGLGPDGGWAGLHIDF